MNKLAFTTGYYESMKKFAGVLDDGAIDQLVPTSVWNSAEKAMVDNPTLAGTLAAVVGTAPAWGGGLIGALRSQEGQGWRGALHGALSGVSTGAGTLLGGAGGALTGGLGGLAVSTSGKDSANGGRRAAGMLLGGAGGAGLGGYGGYKLMQALYGDKALQEIYG